MKFGKILKSLLEEHNLSQSTFANSIGYTQRAVSKWVNEQSEPTESAIVKAADYFELSTDYLLGRSDDFGNIVIQNGSESSFLPSQEQEFIVKLRSLSSSTQAMILRVLDNAVQSEKRA